MSESVALSDKEIKFFAKFMLRYEAMIKDGNIRGFNVNDKGLKAFLRNKRIKIEYKRKVTEYDGSKNTIFFSNTKSSVLLSFLAHVRNSFAHNNIRKEKNVYVLEDYYHKHPTMKGRISSNLLITLIEYIEGMRK